VLEGLLDPEGMLGDLPHELFTGAGEIPPRLDGAGGTKLPRMSPWARRSAIHVASFTSRLRPGIAWICRELRRSCVTDAPATTRVQATTVR
jgi:hypothetical protein